MSRPPHASAARRAPLRLVTLTIPVLAGSVLAPSATAGAAVRTAVAGTVAFVPIVRPPAAPVSLRSTPRVTKPAALSWPGSSPAVTRGFTVNPAQFFYQDLLFTDAGVVEPPNPRWHRVAPGTVYQFSIDYSTISHDPHASKGTGGYVFAPGGAVLAKWSGD